MLADLLKILGIDLKGQVRHAAVTFILLLAGAVAAVLAVGMGFSALYLWLQLEFGRFAALGILGAIFALTALILFAVALLRNRKKRSVRRASALAAADDALDTTVVRRNPRQSAIITILLTIVLGWIVGRRMKR